MGNRILLGYVHRILGSTCNGIFYRDFTEYPTHARTVVPRPFFPSPAKNGLGTRLCMTVLYHYCRVTVLSEGVSSLNEEKESSDNESEHLKYRYLLCILTVICHYVVFGFLRIFS